MILKITNSKNQKFLFLSLILTTLTFSLVACGKKESAENVNKEIETTIGNNLQTETKGSNQSTAPSNSTSIGEDTNEFLMNELKKLSFKSIDGKEDFTFEQIKNNKLTIINFWATFCNPCIQEMPSIAQISEEYKDKGVEVIGIVCDAGASSNYKKEIYDSANTILSSAEAKFNNYETSEEFLASPMVYYVSSIPTTFFIDGDGKLLATHIGYAEYNTWKERVEENLSKSK